MQKPGRRPPPPPPPTLSASGERGEPLPPSFLRRDSPSPSSEAALHFLSPHPARGSTKTNSPAPRGSRFPTRERLPLWRPQPEEASRPRLPTPGAQELFPLTPAFPASARPRLPTGKQPKKGQKRNFGVKLASKRRQQSPQGEGREAGRAEQRRRLESWRGRERRRKGRVPGVGAGSAPGRAPREPRGKYAGHVGGRASGARSWVPSRSATVGGALPQGQGLEGEARGREVRPALGGSRPGLVPHWLGTLGSLPASASPSPW